jgi:L-alanine-DL-glutamate epimerase-like enolase superfamily enzyme
MANMHVAFGAPTCQWLEIPTVGNPLVEALMVEPPVVTDGRIRAPGSPGLGVHLPAEVEERYRYRPSSHYHFEERRA